MPMNDTARLAQFFVRETLGRSWTPADWRGSHIAHAAKVLKLYHYDDIVGCLKDISSNPEKYNLPKNWSILYLLTLLKFEPPLIEQYLAVPEPPPIYEIHAYDDWVLCYGARAMAQGVWGGIYLPIDQPYRLNYYSVAIILGEEMANKSKQEAAKWKT